MLSSPGLRAAFIRSLSSKSSLSSPSAEWVSVIGLEVHAQISSESKLFSNGPSPGLHSPANTCVSLFDASIPGTLPRLNARCVGAGISTSLALGCEVNLLSTFDRKHYFYADLPLGYQITQLRQPLAVNGSLAFWVSPPGKKPYQSHASVIQVQLENDSGKSLIDDEDHQSFIDLNRCGVGLLEIVFSPCLSSPEEAVSLVKELSSILTQVQACSCKMEEGALRVDANISVHKPGTPLGTRTEVKNLNSTRALLQSIEYETQRQIRILEAGGRVHNETLRFDADSRATVSMRDKESKLDYRFMPEPNLLPLKLKDSSLQSQEDIIESHESLLDVHIFRQSLPALPEELRGTLMQTHGLDLSTANLLLGEPKLFNLYTQTMNHPVKSVQTLVSILQTSIQACFNSGVRDLERETSLSPKILASLSNAKSSRSYSYYALDNALAFYLSVPGQRIPLDELISSKGWEKPVNEEDIELALVEILKDHSKKIRKVVEGKDKVLKGVLKSVRKKYQQNEQLELIVERLVQRISQMKE